MAAANAQMRMRIVKGSPSEQNQAPQLVKRDPLLGIAPAATSVLGDASKRDPLLGGGGVSRISSAVQSVATALGGGNSNTGGGSGSSGGSSGSSGGGSSSGGSGSGSGSSGGGDTSGGSTGNNNSGGSSSSGSGSSNTGSNSGSSSSGGESSSSGSSSGSSNSGGGSSSSGGSSGSSNNSGSSSSGGSSSGSSNSNGNNNAGSSNNNNSGGSSNGSSSSSNGNKPATPVTLSNGDVVTPIATIAAPAASNTAASASGVNAVAANDSAAAAGPSSAASIVVVSTNADGASVTATIPYESALSAAATGTGDSVSSVAASKSNGDHHSGPNAATIAGPVAAVLISVVVGAVVFIILRRRRRNRNGQRSTSMNSVPLYANSDDAHDNNGGLTARLAGVWSRIRPSSTMGQIRLPSMPSLPSLPSMPSMPTVGRRSSPQRGAQPEMTSSSPYSATVSLPAARAARSTLFGRVKRYGSTAAGLRRASNSSYDEQRRPALQSSPSIGGYSYGGVGSPEMGARDGGWAVAAAEAAFPRSPPTTFAALANRSPQTHLTSINDALNSGELAYDDDASSGDGSHSDNGSIAEQQNQHGRDSLQSGQFIMVRPPPPHDAHADMAGMRTLMQQNPFSPTASLRSASPPTSFISVGGGVNGVDASPSAESRDTFGMPNYGGNNASPQSISTASFVSMANPSPNIIPPRTSPHTYLARRPTVNAIREEDGSQDSGSSANGGSIRRSIRRVPPPKHRRSSTLRFNNADVE